MSAVQRYRKIPVVIDAVQFGLAEYADEPNEAWRVGGAGHPAWLEQALKAGDRIGYSFESEDYWYFVVHTLEGVMRGGPDDWLIKGVEGELYPCKASVFDATYEEA